MEHEKSFKETQIQLETLEPEFANLKKCCQLAETNLATKTDELAQQIDIGKKLRAEILTVKKQNDTVEKNSNILRSKFALVEKQVENLSTDLKGKNEAIQSLNQSSISQTQEHVGRYQKVQDRVKELETLVRTKETDFEVVNSK